MRPPRESPAARRRRELDTLREQLRELDAGRQLRDAAGRIAGRISTPARAAAAAGAQPADVAQLPAGYADLSSDDLVLQLVATLDQLSAQLLPWQRDLLAAAARGEIRRTRHGHVTALSWGRR